MDPLLVFTFRHVTLMEGGGGATGERARETGGEREKGRADK